MVIWIVIFVALIFGLVARRYWKRGKLAEERAVAVSEYAREFSLLDARRLHDLALTGLVASPQRGADTSQALEIVVALRDRVDELEGRAHGPSNKVRIRTDLASAIAPLFKETALAAGFKVSREFKLGEEIPEGEYEQLSLHITMMGRVYKYLRDAPPHPELEKYLRR
ncbi:MAG: hypothetical protein WCC36_03445 [Gammaproteobacteria bacterium]